MAEEQQYKKRTFSDYLSVLYKWKKFLIINLLIIIIITSLLTLLMHNTYRATTLIMSTPDNSMNLFGLSGLLSNKNSATSFGAKLFGLSTTSDDIIFGLLRSRTVLIKAINKFDLQKYYEQKNEDKLLKSFSSDVSSEPTDYSMIDISVVNKDPELSAKIANYLSKVVDSLNIEINIRQARLNREFIEKRYLQNVTDLKNAEDSLKNFQQKTGVIAIPEQIEAEVKVSAELEAQLVQKQLLVEMIKNQYGIGSPQYNEALTQENFIREKINQLKNSPDLSSTSNFLLPFKNLPQLSLKYFEMYKNIELQTRIMEIILPLYEQAKVEEQKSIPTIYVVDKAVPPQIKYGPKRSLIVAGITLSFLFIFMIMCFQGEYILKSERYKNILEEKQAKFYNRIKRIYKLKID